MMIYSECDQTAAATNRVTTKSSSSSNQPSTASPFSTSSSTSSSSASEYMANGISPKYASAPFSVNSLLNPATAAAFGVLEETYRKQQQQPTTQFSPYQVYILKLNYSNI